jgi:hypothetical protein
VRHRGRQRRKHCKQHGKPRHPRAVPQGCTQCAGHQPGSVSG